MMNALLNYGFQLRVCGLFWGVGSTMWGDTAAVKAVGPDLYEVTVSHWRYNEWGEPLVDITTTAVVHGAQVWSLLPAGALKGRR